MDTIEERAKNYNVNNDHNGAIGRGLASALIAKYGSIEKCPKILSKDMVELSDKIKEIFSGYSPKFLYRSTPKQRQIIKGILGRLKREVKVDVGDYKNSSTIDLWNKYISFAKKFGVVGNNS